MEGFSSIYKSYKIIASKKTFAARRKHLQFVLWNYYDNVQYHFKVISTAIYQILDLTSILENRTYVHNVVCWHPCSRSIRVGRTSIHHRLLLISWFHLKVWTTYFFDVSQDFQTQVLTIIILNKKLVNIYELEINTMSFFNESRKYFNKKFTEIIKTNEEIPNINGNWIRDSKFEITPI